MLSLNTSGKRHLTLQLWEESGYLICVYLNDFTSVVRAQTLWFCCDKTTTRHTLYQLIKESGNLLIF